MDFRRLALTSLVGLLTLTIGAGSLPRREKDPRIATDVIELERKTDGLPSLRTKPMISHPQIHHFRDINKNEIYDIPEETIRVYNSPSLLEDPTKKIDVIPGFGSLALIVPIDEYLGRKIDVVVSEGTPPRKMFELPNHLDLTNKNSENSYSGQPITAFGFSIGKYRENFKRATGRFPEHTGNYNILVVSADGSKSSNFNFRIDHSKHYQQNTSIDAKIRKP